ncbi:MAG TPA: DinB family protein [Ktedonobacterales bacterium]
MDGARGTRSGEEPERLSRRGALRAGAALLLGLGALDAAAVEELARLAQGQPMTSARLAEILQEERAGWRALLDRASPAGMETPGVAGEWSVKQLVAHLTWYERAVLDGAEGDGRSALHLARRWRGNDG